MVKVTAFTSHRHNIYLSYLKEAGRDHIDTAPVLIQLKFITVNIAGIEIQLRNCMH